MRSNFKICLMCAEMWQKFFGTFSPEQLAQTNFKNYDTSFVENSCLLHNWKYHNNLYNSKEELEKKTSRINVFAESKLNNKLKDYSESEGTLTIKRLKIESSYVGDEVYESMQSAFVEECLTKNIMNT